MPETITKYRLFVASPSDVKDDRLAISEVINELNLTFGNQNNLVLELLKWETHSAPAISLGYPQQIINDDIGDSYDLFIGLMWLKFGTPTDFAGSGTEEELNRAFNRFRETGNLPQVLFYFKNSTPVRLSDINTEELQKVNEFRDKIGVEGTLYWQYNTVEELQSYLRIHIPKRINNIIVKNNLTQKKQDNKTLEPIEFNEEEELGILDFLDISIEKFDLSKNAVNNISESTELIANKLMEKTKELNILSSSSYQQNPKLLRKILKNTSQVMTDFASRLSVETPIYFENYNEGMKGISSIINISDDFYDEINITELVDSKKIVIEITSVQNKNLNKKGVGYYPVRDNFTITTKTNSYGKIITFLSNHKFTAS